MSNDKTDTDDDDKDTQNDVSDDGFAPFQSSASFNDYWE